MSDDQFAKLFKHMQSMEKRLEKRFDKQDAEIADLKAAVAELGGQLRDYHQEMIMLVRKVDRMERWIHQIAKQTGIELQYD